MSFRSLKETGAKIVGAYCLFAPYELIAASGAVPVSLCGTSEEPIAHAEKHLPRNLCPLIKSSYRLCRDRHLPLLLLFRPDRGRDNLRRQEKDVRAAGKASRPSMSCVFPSQTTGLSDIAHLERRDPAAQRTARAGVRRRHYRRCPAGADPAAQPERSLCRELYGLSRLDPPPLSGSELHRVLHGSGYCFNKDEQNAKIRALIDEVSCGLWPGEKAPLPTGRGYCSPAAPSAAPRKKSSASSKKAAAPSSAMKTAAAPRTARNWLMRASNPGGTRAKYVRLACSCMSPNDDG